jgi:isopenicillin N synthase-like dioxygenase
MLDVKYFFGTALEFVTRGLARATSHRVLSPNGPTPRYSVPFFQNIKLTIRLDKQVLECMLFHPALSLSQHC